MNKVVSWILIIVFFLSACRNRKAEIVEAMKEAKNHLKQAEIMMDSAMNKEWLANKIIDQGDTVPPAFTDSMKQYIKLSFDERHKWQPIYDSLEMELKKY